MGRLVDCQQLFNFLNGKLDQLLVRTDAFWGHALGNNANLLLVGPDTEEDSIG